MTVHRVTREGLIESNLTCEQRLEGQGIGIAWRQMARMEGVRRVGQNKVKEIRRDLRLISGIPCHLCVRGH